MISVVISGGSGTRLWPESRMKWPKQFSRMFEPCLQIQALKRANLFGDVWVLTTGDLRILTEKAIHVSGITNHHCLYEPTGKNTGPAIALLCRVLEMMGKADEIVGIFPADHLIEKEEVFVEAIRLAEQCARKGYLCTLGITPTFAATGYGYIHTAPTALSQLNGLSAYPIKGFREKPNEPTAQKFLESGSHYWNAGMFVFAARQMINYFKEYQPGIWRKLSELKNDRSNLKQIYAALEPISIDYAIMENVPPEKVVCIPCAMGWSDVGSWDSVADFLSGKASRNVIQEGSSGNFVFGLYKKAYALLGIDDVVVVDTPDAALIVKRGQSQKVRDVVPKILNIAPASIDEHLFDEKPWGRYEVLREENYFKLKVIQVDPEHQISYQSHAKREEHWVVVRGSGEVIIEEKTSPVKKGDYIFIKQGEKHRIRNHGKEPLCFVEVQLGTYFGEDDIIRFADDYDRA